MLLMPNVLHVLPYVHMQLARNAAQLTTCTRPTGSSDPSRISLPKSENRPMEATEASAAAAESPESRPPERTDAQLLELPAKLGEGAKHWK